MESDDFAQVPSCRVDIGYKSAVVYSECKLDTVCFNKEDPGKEAEVID